MPTKRTQFVTSPAPWKSSPPSHDAPLPPSHMRRILKDMRRCRLNSDIWTLLLVGGVAVGVLFNSIGFSMMDLEEANSKRNKVERDKIQGTVEAKGFNVVEQEVVFLRLANTLSASMMILQFTLLLSLNASPLSLVIYCMELNLADYAALALILACDACYVGECLKDPVIAEYC
ncbi:hypothetical protein P8452_10513 [Trifolium repens]|nr:hypothetical protein P8452_10513 [Trifolium repens]